MSNKYSAELYKYLSNKDIPRMRIFNLKRDSYWKTLVSIFVADTDIYVDSI